MLKKIIKRIFPVVCVILMSQVFIFVAYTLKDFFDGEQWYIASSVQRLLFGIVTLIIFVKYFRVEHWKAVFTVRGVKNGLFAGIGLLLYTVYLTVYIAVGAYSFKGLTLGLILTQLVCQQITTGFFEEILYRGLLLEGYFHEEKQNVYKRLMYAGLAFVIFGLVHITSNMSFEQGLDRFITTGIMGFSFAAVYLYSHNLLVTMFLHAIYDIPANLLRYVEWTNTPAKLAMDSMYGMIYPCLFIIALVFIIKSPNTKTKKDPQEKTLGSLFY